MQTHTPRIAVLGVSFKTRNISMHSFSQRANCLARFEYYSFELPCGLSSFCVSR